MTDLKYIAHYPEHIQAQAAKLIQTGQLAAYFESKYPSRHEIQSDKALYQSYNDF